MGFGAITDAADICIGVGSQNSGVTPVFNFADFSGSPPIAFANDTAIVGGVLNICNLSGHQSSGAWYRTKQPPTPFTTIFTWQPSALGAGPPGSGIAASGFTFCIQNTVSPPAAPSAQQFTFADDANACGYTGSIGQNPPQDSIAIKFDSSQLSVGTTYPPGGQPCSTGLYLNGGPSPADGHGIACGPPANDLNPYGISFYNTHVYQVTIVYDGAVIVMVLLDTTTNAQARFEWPLNLANTTNQTSNIVGFTGGTAGSGTYGIQSWSYWSGFNSRLATPTFSPTPGQYSGTQTVSISASAGSNVYYTTNGLLPTSSSTLYTGPITVTKNTQIQAVAIQSGFTDSYVGTGSFQIGTANRINFPSGFAAGDLVLAGYCYLNGSAVRVSDTTGSTVGASWFPIAVPIAAFTTNFTLQWGSSGQGMCFVLQNNPPAYATQSFAYGWSAGPTAFSAAGNAIGYGGYDAESGSSGPGSHGLGFLNSIALAFDQFFVANSIGLYTGGADPQGSQIATGLNFASGHAFTVALTYSGTTLSLLMTDTVTAATFSHSWTIDIPGAIGNTVAYAGFTGGTGGAVSIASITAWQGFP